MRRGPIPYRAVLGSLGQAMLTYMRHCVALHLLIHKVGELGIAHCYEEVTVLTHR